MNSGTQYEYIDAANSLHFYVIDREADANGVLTYTVGARSTAGSGPQTRGVALDNAPAHTFSGLWTYCNFPLANTGVAAPVPPGHPEDVSAYANNDIYRLSASAAGAGWSAQLANALATASFGQAITVPVYVTRTEDSAATAEITLAATSESDATKTDTATCSVTSQPTAVALRSFSARRAGAQTVVLRWRTGAEAGLLGFDLYRGRTRLTRAPIPARNATAAVRYSYLDRVVRRAPRVTYRLQAIKLDGSRVWLGSVNLS